MGMSKKKIRALNKRANAQVFRIKSEKNMLSLKQILKDKEDKRKDLIVSILSKNIPTDI